MELDVLSELLFARGYEGDSREETYLWIINSLDIFTDVFKDYVKKQYEEEFNK